MIQTSGDSTYGHHVLSLSLPSTLAVNAVAPINAVAASGGVSAINIVASANYAIPAGGTNFPAIVVSAASGGGTQAFAIANTLSFNLFGSISSGGTGYAVGNKMHSVSGTWTATVYSVASISGRAGTGLVVNSDALPDDTVSIAWAADTGTGTGLTTHGAVWKILTDTASTTIAASGSDYPAATLAFGIFASNTTSDGASTVSSPLSLSGGGVLSVVLDGDGTKLETVGVSRSSVISQGVLVDASSVRTTLTGAAHTIPANTSLVRFVHHRHPNRHPADRRGRWSCSVVRELSRRSDRADILPDRERLDERRHSGFWFRSARAVGCGGAGWIREVPVGITGPASRSKDIVFALPAPLKKRTVAQLQSDDSSLRGRLEIKAQRC